MQFNREVLRRAAETAITEHRAQHDAKMRTYHEAVAEAKARWVNEYSGSWIVAVRAITDKLNRGKPVLRGDIPQYDRSTSYGNILVFSVANDENGRTLRYPGEYVEPTALRTLLTVLDLVTDEIVTTNALKELGIGQRTMREIVDFVRDSKA